MTEADFEQADDVAWAALGHMIPEEFRDRDVARTRGVTRFRRLLETDPDGCWVAAGPEGVIGVALALVREGLWGLSLFAVAPEHHGRGIGGMLLRRSLGTLTGDGLILSSSDPRAMRSYARAGFSLRPCVAAAGSANRARVPAGLRARPGDPEDDRDTVDAAARHVRGAAYGRDVDALCRAGGELLVIDGRGFAVHSEGSPRVLAAGDEEAATDLLWSCFAAASPGTPLHVDFVSGGQDWAVAVILDAGLSLSPDGPLFVRGAPGPLAPFLPSGAYL